jgi:hypothetical protein
MNEQLVEDVRTYDEPLVIIQGRPINSAGEIGCVMLVVSYTTDESNWFCYKPSFFSPEDVKIEWPRDTMEVVIEEEVAGYLIRNGYARVMTEAEVKAWNAMINPETKETKP